MKTVLKRLLSLLLSFVMACSLVVVPAQAATEQTINLKLTCTYSNKALIVSVAAETSDSKDFPISSGQIQVKYDEDIFTYRTVQAGDVPAVPAEDEWSQPTQMDAPVGNAKEGNGYVGVALMSKAKKAHVAPNGTVLAKIVFIVKDNVEACKTRLEFTHGKQVNNGVEEEVPNRIAYAVEGEKDLYQHTLNETSYIDWDVPGVLPTLNAVKFVEGAGETATEKDSITVNVTGSGEPKTVQAKAYSAKTPNPTDITESVTWSVTNPTGGKGVTINANTGVISVDPKAMNGSYTITATPVSGKSLGTAKTATLTVTRATAELTTIELDKQSVQVDGTSGDSITVTPRDQFGDTMDSSFTWQVTPTDSSISVSGNTITVGAKAAANANYTVKASNADTPTATFAVTRATAAAAKVEITDSQSGTAIEIPDDANTSTPETREITVAVKDQFDDPMSGQTLTWAVTIGGETVPNTSVKVEPKTGADGTYTVSIYNAVKDKVTSTSEIEATITAKAGSAANAPSGTTTIKLKRKAQVATKAELYKGDSATPLGTSDTLVIPLDDSTTTAVYKPKLFDQYGSEMTSQTWSWTTDPATPATGLTFSSGTLTVSKDASESSTLKITATASEQSAAVTVSFVKLQVQWDPVDSARKQSGITYGDTYESVFTSLPETGTAKLGENTSYGGKFTVLDATEKLLEASADDTDTNKKSVTVRFTVTDGPYKNTTIDKEYKVTVAKKPITLAVKETHVAYGETIPATFEVETPASDALVGSDTVGTLKLKFKTNVADGSTPNAGGKYTVSLADDYTQPDNYEVTLNGTDKLVIDKAKIKTVTTTATAKEIFANNENNASDKLLAAAGLSVADKVTATYGSANKTEELDANWALTSGTFNAKGGDYTFTAKVVPGDNFELSADVTLPTVTLKVKAVTGTAALAEGAEITATKAFSEVNAAADLKALGVPEKVKVTYTPAEAAAASEDIAAVWTPDLAALKNMVKGGSDKYTQELTIDTAKTGYPAWATIADDSVKFTLVMTKKLPVTVRVTAPTEGLTYKDATPLNPQGAHDTPASGTIPADATYRYEYAVKGSTTPLEGVPTDAGIYTVKAILDTDTHYGESEAVEFTIQPKTLAAGSVTLVEVGYNPTYIPNTAFNPDVTVKDGETVLKKTKDYTVAYTDNNKAGTATVTVTGTGNYTGTDTTTFNIGKATLDNTTATLTINGTPKAGEVLTATLGSVDPKEVEFTWTVGGTTSSGATYQVKPADSNKTITVKADAKSDGNYTGSVTVTPSEGVTVEKVKISGTVTISGTGTGANGALKGSDTLTANITNILPTEAQSGVTYQWMRDGASIDGATSNTYTGTDGDTGSITVVVTAGGDFTGSLESNAVELGKAPLGGNVAISGAAEVGQTLTANVGSVTPSGAAYTYTWLRDGAAIPNANGNTYEVVAADQGKTISVKLTATGDYTGELVSTGTAIPAGKIDTPTVTATAGNGEVTVSWNTPNAYGAPVIGYTVTATPAGGSATTVDLPLGTNSYTFTGLTNDTAYTFTVVAKASATDKSSTPGTATATPKAPVTPDEPEPEYPPFIPPVFVDPGTGGSGSGNGSGGTTTTPDKEVTENPDGSTVTVETQPDGTVVTTTVESDGSTAVKMENPDGSSTTTIQKADGSEAIVNTDASGKTSAVVDLSNEAVSSAQNTGAAVALPIENVTATRDTETAPTVVVNTESEQPVKVEIPVSNAGTGTVAVLVKADGTEEIIKTTVPTAGGIAVKLNSGDAVKVVDNSKFFADTATHWGGGAVDFVSARELFGGTGENKFSPDDAMTRGMLMTVLARYENVDTTGGATWYEKGVAWAVAQGLSDGTNPNGGITREQLATIIYRYAQSKGVDTTVSGNLERFPDAGKVSDWAREAMSWAVGEGIISGVGGVTLDPAGNATRAQVATIIMRYAERFAE